MAKIILNVELSNKTSSGLKNIETDINNIGKAFSKNTKKLDTAQLEKGVNNLRKGYSNLLNTIQGTEKYYKKGTFSNIAKDAEKYLTQLKGLDKTSNNYQQEVKRLQVELNKLQANFAETRQQATNFHGSLQEIVGGFIKFQAAAMIVMKPLQMVRNAWASINETLVKTEDAVIAIKRVLNDGSLSDSTISGKLYDLAQRYGQTFDNVNDIAQNFARTGMSWVETIQATESALLALNVAELDATQASDGMIAVMQQFGYEASELTGIIDILNKTADNYAVTTDKLLTALQRTGSSAKNAGLDLSQTVGLITALSESTGRSGENIGTAVNSLIQYSSKESALDTFASLDQNTADIVAKYRKGGATILDVWMAVSGVINNMDSRQEGILAGLGNSADITDLNQELQDELGDIFETVNDVYGTANTFRKNYFVALLGNMQTVKDAIETTSDASGYSAKENEEYLESYTAKVNTLNAKWEELANNEQGFLSFKKGLVDVGITGLEVLDWMGGLRTATVALGGVALSTLPSINLKLKDIGITINSLGGWLTLGATALSAIIGIVDNVKQAKEEERQETIANYEANKKEADSLLELYNRFTELESITEKTADQQKEFNTVTESLVTNLGYETYKLKGLKEGSEEYLQVLKDITQEQLKQYALDSQANANAQKDAYNDYSAGELTLSTGVVGENSSLISALLKSEYKNLILKRERGGILGSTDFYLKGTGNAIDTVDTYEDLQTWLYDNGFGESEIYNTVTNRLKKAKEKSETYLKAQIENLFYKNASENGIDYAQDNFESIINGLVDDNDIKSDYLLNFVEEYAKGIFGIKEETEKTVDTTKTWEETLNSTLNNYADLYDYLTGIRDREKEINDLEEKRQALEDARNNKTVYQYNAEKGGWERVADEKAIAEAEEAYEDALLKSMQNEELTVGQILKKVEDLPALTSGIATWLKEQGYDVPEDMMFGSSATVASPTSGMTTNSNSTTNNNTSYVINGVPIPQEIANKYNLSDIIEEVANLPN